MPSSLPLGAAPSRAGPLRRCLSGLGDRRRRLGGGDWLPLPFPRSSRPPGPAPRLGLSGVRLRARFRRAPGEGLRDRDRLYELYE